MTGPPLDENGNSIEARRDPTTDLRCLTVRPSVGKVLFPLNGDQPSAAEQYRIIRTRVVLGSRPVRMLCISSPQIGDGKSVTAVNLAGAIALKSGESVLLVDADLRRSGLASMLGVPPSPGLADVLQGQCLWQQAVGRLKTPPNLFFLPAGMSAAHPAELFDSPVWGATCAELRRYFRWILFDAPPVGLVADYFLIEAVSDGVIVVVRPDHTRRSLCFRALETVPKDKLLGVVINMAPNWFLSRGAAHVYPEEAGSGKPRQTEQSP